LTQIKPNAGIPLDRGGRIGRKSRRKPAGCALVRPPATRPSAASQNVRKVFRTHQARDR